jgi:hypothetical protein
MSRWFNNPTPGHDDMRDMHSIHRINSPLPKFKEGDIVFVDGCSTDPIRIVNQNPHRSDGKWEYVLAYIIAYEEKLTKVE